MGYWDRFLGWLKSLFWK
jgi:ADP-ribosylation factor-like protein 8